MTTTNPNSPPTRAGKEQMTYRFDIAAPIKLVDRFAALLTQAEANQWSEFMDANATWIAYCKESYNRKALHAVICGGATNREQEYLDSSQRMSDLSDQLYAIAKDWYAALVAKDVKEPATT